MSTHASRFLIKQPPKFPGWPSGENKPLFEYLRTPQEIASRFGLRFRRERDDLDWYVGAYFVDEQVGPVVFQKHENEPNAGTILYVDSKLDSGEAMSYLKELLHVADAEIGWQQADV